MHIMAQRFNSKLDAQLLGRRLRAARKARGETLISLAVATGVHHSQISRIERGEVVTLNKNVQKICEFLNETDDPFLLAAAPTLGQRVDRLLLAAPENEEVLRVLVEALEALRAKAS